MLVALFAFAGKVKAQTANLQIIHNSADALVDEMDIFVNGAPFLTDVSFRQATGFMAVPAGVELSIIVSPAGAGIGNGVGPINVTLTEDQNYIAIASGIVSSTGYSPAPPFSLEVFTPARQVANNPSEVDVLVFHGSTDAPEVSVWAMGAETGLFTFSYTDFQGYLSLPVDDYVLEIRTPDGQIVVAAFEAPLSTLDLGGAALTVLASGFLNPSNNSNGPAFGLFVAGSTAGALLPLPVYTPTPTTVVDIITGSDIHTTLATAVTVAGLVETLQGEGPFTVFAPTDAAFAALPEGVLDALIADPTGALTDVLLYHVVAASALSTDLTDGQEIETVFGQNVVVTINTEGVFINDAQVIVADLIADNGVVHVIDAVLVPASETTTVVDIIVGSDIHTTLATAVTLAGLVETLQGEGPFTVFAPTDAAFAALPAGVLDALIADPTGALTDVLLYHVVAASALSTDLTDGQEIETVFGQNVVVTINTEGVFINDAQVIVADLIADNGVVHVIDAVLVPILSEPVFVEFPFFEDFENAETYGNWTLIDGAGSGFVWSLGSTTNFNISDPMEGNYAWIDSDAAGSGNNVWTILQTPGIVLNDFNGGDIVLSFAHHYRQIGAQRGYVRYSNDGSNWETLATYDANQGSSAGFSGPFTVTAVTETLIIPGMEQGDTLYVRFEFDDNDVWGWYWLIDNISVAAAAETTTVVDIIAGSDVHTTLATAVTVAGLVETLQGDGPFTVFAPTDAAFEALPDGLLDELLADPTGALTDVLLYHVVAAFALSTDLTDGQEIETVLGQNVVVTINNDGVFINNALVSVAYLIADNGVVHVIDAVLVPAFETTTVVDIIAGSEIHTTLATAVTLAGLVETLQGEGPFTVFAPTNAAFDALPDGLLDELLADPTGALTDVLLYHVVAAFALSTDLTDGQEIETVLGQNVVVTINNDGVFINNALVSVADLIADNGVVHVIDAVLVPASTPATVVDIIVSSEIHTTLATAVTVAGLVEALQGEGPFTVFAPTDAAFAALPAGVLDELLADPSGALTQVLLYHVVAGAALSTDLTDGQTIATLFGENISVSISSAGVFINDAQVIVADLIAENGVVHVIDAVLVPTTLSTNDIAGNFGQFNVFPNPVRDQINLVFDMQRSDNVVVEIFNITGARVMSMELGSRNGTINERIDVSGLTQGVYIMNVRSSSDVISRKINIVK